MKVLFPLLAVAIAAAPCVCAAAVAAVQEASSAPPAPPLQLRPKSVMMGPAKAHSAAPFVLPASDHQELDFNARHDPRQETSRSSCKGERDLCYDAASGRIVYKPARALMPDLPGLQPENISVKRDRITFKYSF